MYFSDKFESIGCPDMQDVDAGGMLGVGLAANVGQEFHVLHYSTPENETQPRPCERRAMCDILYRSKANVGISEEKNGET